MLWFDYVFLVQKGLSGPNGPMPPGGPGHLSGPPGHPSGPRMMMRPPQPQVNTYLISHLHRLINLCTCASNSMNYAYMYAFFAFAFFCKKKGRARAKLLLPPLGDADSKRLECTRQITTVAKTSGINFSFCTFISYFISSSRTFSS